MDDDLFLGGVMLLLLQLGQELCRFFVSASVDAEQGQDQSMSKLIRNCVDSGVKGEGLIVFAVSKAKLRVIFQWRNWLIVDQHQIQILLFSLLDTIDGLIFISQASLSF